MSRLFTASQTDYILGTDAAGVTPAGTSWTAAAWIKPATLGGKYFGKWHDQGDPGAFEWLLSLNSSGKLVLAIYDGVDFRIITGATTLSVNTWYHVALIQNGTGAGSLTAYLNGVSDGTSTTSAAPNNSTTPVKIGGGGNGATHEDMFDGLISRCAFWNGTALSGANLTALQTQSPDDAVPTGLTFYTIDTANEIVDYIAATSLSNNGSDYSAEEPFSEGGGVTAKRRRCSCGRVGYAMCCGKLRRV